MKRSDSKIKYNNVLLIDDSDIDIFINRRLLEASSSCSTISVASTAAEALSFLQQCLYCNAPDVIFLDINLPIVDGFGFLDKFEQLPYTIKEKIKIIILSVYDDKACIEKTMANKYVWACLRKPLSEKALLEINF